MYMDRTTPRSSYLGLVLRCRARPIVEASAPEISFAQVGNFTRSLHRVGASRSDAPTPPLLPADHSIVMALALLSRLVADQPSSNPKLEPRVVEMAEQFSAALPCKPDS